MRDGFRIYDSHAHLGVSLHSGRVHTLEGLLRDMDRAGVDRTLLMPFPLVEDFRATHDEIARAVRAHPDRLVGATSLNPFIPEAEFRQEVRRCATEFGFRALKLQPQYQPLNPISSRSDFFFATALEYGLPVICHTGAGAPYALPSLFILPARKFPDLRFVLAHAGGGLYVAEAIVAATVCPNICVELSWLAPHQVRAVLDHLPASRLMIGSDLPENLEAELSKILALDLPPPAKQAILFDTAAAVFDQRT
jgi:hypothetical protein